MATKFSKASSETDRDLWLDSLRDCNNPVLRRRVEQLASISHRLAEIPGPGESAEFDLDEQVDATVLEILTKFDSHLRSPQGRSELACEFNTEISVQRSYGENRTVHLLASDRAGSMLASQGYFLYRFVSGYTTYFNIWRQEPRFLRRVRLFLEGYRQVSPASSI